MARRVAKFFDEWLNTPKAVVVVLAVILAANGLLLYYLQPATPTTSAPPTPPTDISAASTDATVPAGRPEEPSPGAKVPVGEPEDSSPEAPVASGAPEPETPSSGDPGEPSRGCGGDREECARELVAEGSPEGSYNGGRGDLGTGDPGQNEEVLYFEEVVYFEEVLYFEDPTLGVCEYTLQEYEANDGTTYPVFTVGPDTFDGEGGSGCVP